jgi:polysaccharide biosynthesis protein PslG
MSDLSTPWRRMARLGALAVCALLAVVASASAAAPSLTVLAPGRSPVSGIQDDRMAYVADPAARVRLLADAGASVIRVDMRWDTVATARPTNPTNPADPAYDWHQYDAIVAAARTYNLRVLFSVYGTPAWAADMSVRSHPDYESRFPDTTFRPLDPADFGAFGEAAAIRYAPQGVHDWEAWNEPNIALFLQPQYERVGGGWVAASPAIYSGLLKSFYAAVKRADPTATVAGAVTAPAGDVCPAGCVRTEPPVRVTPQAFVAALNAPGLRPPMDVVSHHPYPLSQPRTFTAPGRSYIDLYNLDVLTKGIDATYLRGKPLWLTEFGFATNAVPEYGQFFSKAKQAEYIADAYRRTKANRRVTLTVYYFLQDHPGWASGVLGQNGAPKPGYQAIGLPFATATGTLRFARNARVTLVGQSRVGKGNHTVEIQYKNGAVWSRAKRLTTAADGSFKVRLRLTVNLTVRALWNGVSPTGGATKRTSPPLVLRVGG